MNIIKFVNKFEEVLDLVQYKLYFGTKGMYFAEHRDIMNNEVILEPFPFKVYVEDKCYIDTNLTLWILKKREVDNKFSSASSGIELQFAQQMIDDTKNILNEINESGFMMISQKLDTIQLQHYQPDSSASVNTQSIIKATFPVRIYQNYDS